MLLEKNGTTDFSLGENHLTFWLSYIYLFALNTFIFEEEEKIESSDIFFQLNIEAFQRENSAA
jgi:hypothetical protein